MDTLKDRQAARPLGAPPAAPGAMLEGFIDRFRALLVRNAEACESAERPICRIFGHPIANPDRKELPAIYGYEGSMAALLDEFEAQIGSREDQTRRLEAFL